MTINRPHIIAKKSIIPALKISRLFFAALFLALAVVSAIMGEDLFSSIGFLSSLAPYSILIAGVFLILALIPVAVIVIEIIIIRSQRVEFYDSFVIKRSGVFNKFEQKCMFPKILSCDVYRSFKGRIFNYGDIKVDAIGKWDLEKELRNVSRPLFVRKYLQNHFISAKEIRAMRQTIVTQ